MIREFDEIISAYVTINGTRGGWGWADPDRPRYSADRLRLARNRRRPRDQRQDGPVDPEPRRRQGAELKSDAVRSSTRKAATPSWPANRSTPRSPQPGREEDLGRGPRRDRLDRRGSCDRATVRPPRTGPTTGLECPPDHVVSGGSDSRSDGGREHAPGVRVRPAPESRRGFAIAAGPGPGLGGIVLAGAAWVEERGRADLGAGSPELRRFQGGPRPRPLAGAHANRLPDQITDPRGGGARGAAELMSPDEPLDLRSKSDTIPYGEPAGCRSGRRS